MYDVTGFGDVYDAVGRGGVCDEAGVGETNGLVGFGETYVGLECRDTYEEGVVDPSLTGIGDT